MIASFGNWASAMESWMVARTGSPWVHPAMLAFATIAAED